MAAKLAAKPLAVGDGMAAISALQGRHCHGQPLSLVLLDAGMPEMDGLTVAAMIRKTPELAATRIILLTSWDRPDEPDRFGVLRIDAHLLKPVQQGELFETICRVMGRATEGMKDEGGRMKDESGSMAEDRQSASSSNSSLILHPSSFPLSSFPLHILAAEDDELSRQVLKQMLIRQGHRVWLAANGREALTLLEQGGFDLLILDVHMPELDGFQVVRAVRDLELNIDHEYMAPEHLPVIALTALARKEDSECCLAAGMDYFLTKPVQPADLWAAIERVLKTRSARRPTDLDLLDVPVLLAACGGDAALLGKMCHSLESQVPRHLAVIHDALRDEDTQRLREAAHKCCGILSMFSTVVGDLAGNLEGLAADAKRDKAPLILEQLETLAAELLNQVAGLSIGALRRNERVLRPRAVTCTSSSPFPHSNCDSYRA